MKNQSQICWAPALQTFTIRIFFSFLFVLINLQRVLGQFQDDFSDNDFTNAPSWSGSNSLFVAEGSQLKLQAPEQDGVAFLSTPSAALNDAEWEFKVTLEFNPSSSNFAKIYLASDQEDLSSTLNGYFVMVGDSHDEISLYLQNGTTSSKIIDGRDGILNLSTVSAKIKVTRNKGGGWKLFSDVGVTGNYDEEGSVEHALPFSCRYFGIFCKYTSTRSTKFYFDDFKVTGEVSEDPAPPPPVTPSNYKDVIITEIFPDPLPTSGLPETEFVEIYNRTDHPFNLSGWKFGDQTSTSVLPSIICPPRSYLVLTSSGTSFSQANVLSLSNFPSLNNATDEIVLQDQNGTIIDSVNYFDSWYKDDDKRNGGWSLELIDPNNVCSENQNWTASESANGGTPGEQNSVFAEKPDLTGPKLLSAIPIGSQNVQLMFDEKLENNLPELLSLNVDPPLPLSNVSFSDASLTSLQIRLQNELQTGLLYTINANKVYDCAGNQIQEEFSSLTFGVPEKADSLDIVINEILFNPRPTGIDFVEIVNHSSKFINLKDWSIATEEDGNVKDQAAIATKDLLFKPGNYLALTENPGLLKSEYIQGDESTFLQVDNLPSFNDEDGNIVLLDDAGKTIDHLSYHKDMHSVFIKDDEGVSLERISMRTLEHPEKNWKSASSTVGFATPGYANSNTVSEILLVDPISIVPEIFDPLSSQPDFATIEYNFDKGGYVANIKIFNPQGHVIKHLANNDVLSATGFYRWDGDRDDGSKASVGYYMIWFEIVDDTGYVKKFQKRVVIAAQF